MTVEGLKWNAMERSGVAETSAALAPTLRDAPFASFIVCTRNRAEALETCIRSIEAACGVHAAVRWELVIVDNGSTDDTPERIARIITASPLPVTHVVERRPGLAAARNAAMARAGGGILIFIDDDCEVDANYLRDLERHYAGGEAAIIRGGRVDLGDASDLPFTIKRSSAR